MTTIELEAKKAELARRILIENDEFVIDKVMVYFTKVKKTTAKPLRQYSLEEPTGSVREADIKYRHIAAQEDVSRFTVENLKSEIKKSEEAFDKKLFVTQEDMRKRHPRV